MTYQPKGKWSGHRYRSWPLRERPSPFRVSSIRRQLREHHNQLAKEINADAFEKGADDLIFIPEVDKFDAPAYQVVRSKEFVFGPMSVQEAILQMNLIGHSFFAFRNEDRDGAFSVVYRRNDGG